MVVRKPVGFGLLSTFWGLAERELLLLWKRWLLAPRRVGGGGGRRLEEGEAALEDARLLATMALARESTVTDDLVDAPEVELRRLCCWA